MANKVNYTEAEVVGALRGLVAWGRGGQSAWARANDFARGYVSDVLAGRRPVSDRLAAALGFEPARLWRKRTRGEDA